MISALLGDLIPYIVMVLTAVAGIWGYGKLEKRKGITQERAETKQKDAEHAQDIRDRVSTGRADGVQPFKDRGYRD